MLQKRKEAKTKKSIAETLLRDMQGSAAEKLALFEKLKARGGFDGENRRELLKGAYPNIGLRKTPTSAQPAKSVRAT
jgi:hypothetical protein